MKRNKIILYLISFMLIILVFSTTVYADFGPKDSLTVYLKNPPNENYYLDLLTTKSSNYNNFHKDGERESLNQEMLNLLYSYKEEGWLPALTEGTGVPMWGELTGKLKNGEMVHKFGYVGLPETYRIIIVTESGKVTVSDTYTRKALQSSIRYDYNTSNGEVPSVIIAYLVQFLTTCIPTLIIELALLLLFGFKLKNNYKVFLLTNFFTQIFLTATLGSTLIKSGSVSAYFIQFPVEIIIIIVESIIYVRMLQGYTAKRRCVYGIVANLLSWGISYFFISRQYRFLISFL